jgi:hypothetical protein
VGIAAAQPIPFRHDIHAGRLRLDCRHCHGTVETSAAAGMPSAETCMTCHSQVWSGSRMLEPLRTSLAFGAPLEWASVHVLPDHAHFHHGVHVAKGVACRTCHGRVDLMAVTVKAEPLSMAWCLECHRNPGPQLGPPELAFSMSGDDDAPAAAAFYTGPTTGRLTDCSTCHR